MLLQNKYKKCDYCLLFLSSFCVVCVLFLLLSFLLWMTLSIKRVPRRGARVTHIIHYRQGWCVVYSSLVLTWLILSCLVLSCRLLLQLFSLWLCHRVVSCFGWCYCLSLLLSSLVLSVLVLPWPQVLYSPSGRLCASSSFRQRLGKDQEHKKPTVFVVPCLVVSSLVLCSLIVWSWLLLSCLVLLSLYSNLCPLISSGVYKHLRFFWNTWRLKQSIPNTSGLFGTPYPIGHYLLRNETRVTRSALGHFPLCTLWCLRKPLAKTPNCANGEIA